jgi:hypothetical protein
MASNVQHHLLMDYIGTQPSMGMAWPITTS